MINPARKLIQKTGFDFHRYRLAPDKLSHLHLFNLRTILDIGANTGQFAKEIRGLLPDVQIYSFEPLNSCFEALERGFQGDLKFKAFNYALGNEEGEVAMHKSAYAPSSSILAMSTTHKDLFPHTKDHVNENVTVKRLDDVVKDLSLGKEILIKVDVQGFEEKVLDGGLNTFKLAKAVIMEVSFVELYAGQPTFDTLYQILRSLGFEYHGSLQQKLNKETGAIISEDSIFIRNNE